jgi:hypothetical protein
LAKRIHTENQKLALATEKEKSASRSRALRDYLATAKQKLTISYNTQALIDEELYTAYLAWLSQFDFETAYQIFDNNIIFGFNMGSTKYMALRAELDRRRGILI